MWVINYFSVSFPPIQAYFSTPFSSLALCVEGCASYTFSRILGKSKASEMLLLNHKLSAAEAYKFGLVSEVYTKSELDTVLWPKLLEHSKLPKDSLTVTKKLMTESEIEIMERYCHREMEELSKRYESPEFLEAVARFMLPRKSKLWTVILPLSRWPIHSKNFIRPNYVCWTLLLLFDKRLITLL